MTTYYLVRHGVTDWIEQGIVQGSSDRPLSSFGLEQAQLTGEALNDSKAARLFSSPMIRAMQTAQAISKTTGLAVESVEGLKEMDQGWMEGKRDHWPKFKNNFFWLGLYFLFRRLVILLSGESPASFKKHVLDAWTQIRSQAGNEPVIIVAHSGVLRTIMMHELGSSLKDTTRFFTDTCSISEIEIEPSGAARLVRLNDASHLGEKTGA